jgi:hypothetical protein
LIFPLVVVGLVALLTGGFAVWGGFIWTLFSYYVPSRETPPDRDH